MSFLSPSFPNSIWERNCPRNSIASVGAKWNFADNKKCSQIEFGNEEGELR